MNPKVLLGARVMWIIAAIALIVLGTVAAIALRRALKIAPLPAAAYVRPDQPNASPSHVLLPESALADPTAFFGKPGQLARTWTPSREQINTLELDLPKLSSLHEDGWIQARTIEDPSSYNMQFLGVETNGNRRIYVNAACSAFGMNAAEWNRQLIIVSDGGSCYWHVFYDPNTRRFANLEINGRA
jgi:hypothetical protein